jgi:hypothetical protein
MNKIIIIFLTALFLFPGVYSFSQDIDESNFASIKQNYKVKRKIIKILLKS